jgi:hypothetical protein
VLVWFTRDGTWGREVVVAVASSLPRAGTSGTGVVSVLVARSSGAAPRASFAFRVTEDERTLTAVAVAFALSVSLRYDGTAVAARMPRTAATTSSSASVNPS